MWCWIIDMRMLRSSKRHHPDSPEINESAPQFSEADIAVIGGANEESALSASLCFGFFGMRQMCRLSPFAFAHRRQTTVLHNLTRGFAVLALAQFYKGHGQCAYLYKNPASLPFSADAEQ